MLGRFPTEPARPRERRSSVAASSYHQGRCRCMPTKHSRPVYTDQCRYCCPRIGRCHWHPNLAASYPKRGSSGICCRKKLSNQSGHFCHLERSQGLSALSGSGQFHKERTWAAKCQVEADWKNRCSRLPEHSPVKLGSCCFASSTDCQEDRQDGGATYRRQQRLPPHHRQPQALDTSRRCNSLLPQDLTSVRCHRARSSPRADSCC